MFIIIFMTGYKDRYLYNIFITGYKDNVYNIFMTC